MPDPEQQLLVTNGLGDDVLASSILVVGMSEVNTKHFAQVLTSVGFCNVHAEHVPRNITARMHDLKPDLIALDLQLPESSGLEFAGLVESYEDSRHDGPLLVISAE